MFTRNIDPHFLRTRAEAIQKLKIGFPGDAEAIQLLAEMNPTAMPRLEPLDEKGKAVEGPVLFRTGLRWRLVWDQLDLRDIT